MTVDQPSPAPGQHSGTAHDRFEPGSALDEAVEIGDQLHRGARVRIELGQPTDEFPHGPIVPRETCPLPSHITGNAPGPDQSSVDQLPMTLRSHSGIGTLEACASAACGAYLAKPWNAPGQTCNSALPPACQIREA